MTLQHVKFNLSLGKHATMNIFVSYKTLPCAMKFRELAVLLTLLSMSIGLEGCRQIQLAGSVRCTSQCCFNWNPAFPVVRDWSFFQCPRRCWKKELFLASTVVWGLPTKMPQVMGLSLEIVTFGLSRTWLHDEKGHNRQKQNRHSFACWHPFAENGKRKKKW